MEAAVLPWRRPRATSRRSWSRFRWRSVTSAGAYSAASKLMTASMSGSVILGSSIGLLVHYFTSFPISLPWWSFAIGIGFSASVGIFFGLYPAFKASRLDPIEALRYE